MNLKHIVVILAVCAVAVFAGRRRRGPKSCEVSSDCYRQGQDCASITSSECRAECDATNPCDEYGQLCTNGLCVKAPRCERCSASDPCPTGQTCQIREGRSRGKCALTCTESATCPTGDECREGVCRRQLLAGECELTSQCEANQVCMKKRGRGAGVCRQTCSTASPSCPTGETCHSGRRGVSYCKKPREVCGSDSDCTVEGENCYKKDDNEEGFCRQTCVGTGQSTCEGRQTCQEGFCKRPHGPRISAYLECNTATNPCQSGETCVTETNKVCLKTCTAGDSSACCRGKTCQGGYCLSPPPVAPAPLLP